MHLHGSRVLFLSPRIAAIVLAIVVITSCNQGTPTSPGNQGSETSGPLATSQQAIKGSGVACPARHHPETWYLCLDHSITTQFFAPPGNYTMSAGGGDCVGVIVESGVLGFSDVNHEFPVYLTGKAEDDDVRCTIEGQTTLTVTASGECRGSQTGGVESLTIMEHWGIAEAQLKCECKGEGDCHPYNGPIQLAGLGDQEIPWEFLLRNTSAGDCKPLPISGGIIYGQLNYCFQNYSSIELVPLVPPTP